MVIASVNGAAGEVHAAIDVGTNSFHLVLARVGSRGGLEILHRDKEVVRLGSGSGDMRRLSPDAIDRGIAALKAFARTAASYGAGVRAVATSAVREAENRREFLDRAAQEAGIVVEVVSGAEEARLIHLGVLQALMVFDQQILLVDIGGGSTELLIGRGERPLAARSVKLGHVRLTERFFPSGVADPAAVAECRAYVRSILTPLAHDLVPLGFDLAVGSSGTIATVARLAELRRNGAGDGAGAAGRRVNDAPRGRVFPMFRRRGAGAAGRRVNPACFSRGDLAAVTAAVLAGYAPATAGGAAPGAGRGIAGVEGRRAEVITAGVLLLEGVFDCFGVESMTVSGYALREGVLLDAARNGNSAKVTAAPATDLRVRVEPAPAPTAGG